MRFVPAPPDTGCIFVRTDLRLRVHVPATAAMVTGTQRRTTLGRTPSQVMLVEHCLAALAGLRIDNCYVELDGSEPPGLDGSAAGFVAVLNDAGAVPQAARRPVWAARRTMTVAAGGATLTLYPPEPGDHESLRISYLLDYGLGSPIDRQSHTQIMTPERFAAHAPPKAPASAENKDVTTVEVTTARVRADQLSNQVNSSSICRSQESPDHD